MQKRTKSIDPEQGLHRLNTNPDPTPPIESPGDNTSPTSIEDFGVPTNGHPINGQDMGSSSIDTPDSETLMRNKSYTENIHPSMKEKAKHLVHRGGSIKSEKDANGVIAEQNDDSRSTKSKKFAGKKFTFMGQLRATVLGSWINVLLICVPVGIGLNYSNVNRIAVFVINFLAIIPLAGMLSYSTEEISMRVGETLGGLMNASFGSVKQLINRKISPDISQKRC